MQICSRFIITPCKKVVIAFGNRLYRAIFLIAKLQQFPETQGLFEKYPQKMGAVFCH